MTYCSLLPYNKTPLRMSAHIIETFPSTVQYCFSTLRWCLLFGGPRFISCFLTRTFCERLHICKTPGHSFHLVTLCLCETESHCAPFIIKTKYCGFCRSCEPCPKADCLSSYCTFYLGGKKRQKYLLMVISIKSH